jgi:hypothetical protein
MTDKLWKKHERRVAKYFGVKRTPLSGSTSLHTSGDIVHDILYVEHKLRKRHAILSLFDKVKKLAIDEDKIPVVTISEPGRSGFFLLINSADLLAVANQRKKINMEGGV